MTTRTSRIRRSAALMALGAASLGAGVATAAPVVSNTTQFNAAFAVSSTDLLQTHVAGVTASGDFSRENAMGVSALTDGGFGTQGNQGNGGAAATAEGGNVLTYRLDRGSNGTGWDIATVTTYAGWDQYRGGQAYTLSYSTVDAPTVFITLASVFNDPVSAAGGINTDTRALISDSTGLLASNVDSLRFTFSSSLTAGYAGYREIDVTGLASAVPEPSSLALGGLALALMGVGAAKRRSRG